MMKTLEYKRSQELAAGYMSVINRVKDNTPEIEALRKAKESLEQENLMLKRRYAELQLRAEDLENQFAERVNEKLAELMENNPSSNVKSSKSPLALHGRGAGGEGSKSISPEQLALIAIEEKGEYVDINGKRWLDITEAARLKNVSYQTIYRAAKGITQSAHIEVWTIGQHPNGTDRLLVNPDSYMRGKHK